MSSLAIRKLLSSFTLKLFSISQPECERTIRSIVSFQILKLETANVVDFTREFSYTIKLFSLNLKLAPNLNLYRHFTPNAISFRALEEYRRYYQSPIITPSNRTRDILDVKQPQSPKNPLVLFDTLDQDQRDHIHFLAFRKYVYAGYTKFRRHANRSSS